MTVAGRENRDLLRGVGPDKPIGPPPAELPRPRTGGFDWPKGISRAMTPPERAAAIKRARLAATDQAVPERFQSPAVAGDDIDELEAEVRLLDGPDSLDEYDEDLVDDDAPFVAAVEAITHSRQLMDPQLPVEAEPDPDGYERGAPLPSGPALELDSPAASPSLPPAEAGPDPGERSDGPASTPGPEPVHRRSRGSRLDDPELIAAVRRAYYDDGLSQEAVAKVVGLTGPQTSVLMKRHGMKIRSRAEQVALGQHVNTGRPRQGTGEVHDPELVARVVALYTEQGWTQQAVAKAIGRRQEIVAEILTGAGVPFHKPGPRPTPSEAPPASRPAALALPYARMALLFEQLGTTCLLLSGVLSDVEEALADQARTG